MSFRRDAIWPTLKWFATFHMPITIQRTLKRFLHDATGHSRSFKVIYFGVTEKPLDNITLYNNRGLRCEGS